MIEYRIYWRDGVGRILKAPDVIIADDDHDALRRAGELKSCSCEVWQEARLVGVIDSAKADQ